MTTFTEQIRLYIRLIKSAADSRKDVAEIAIQGSHEKYYKNLSEKKTVSFEVERVISLFLCIGPEEFMGSLCFTHTDYETSWNLLISIAVQCVS